jgi:subtilisin family serine protease
VKYRALVLLSLLATTARAEVDVRALAAAVARSSGPPSPSTGFFGDASLGAIIELPQGEDPAAYGLPRIGSHFTATQRTLAELDALARSHPSWRVTWSPPLRPLLDKATAWSRAPEFRNDTGLTGKGAVVGIVDAAIDVRHRDLRNPDGTTRIAWLVDFSRGPGGKHPEENICACGKLTCPKDTKPAFPCRIYSAAELDELVAAGRDADIPSDLEGHGTHVASLAAGNGGSEGKYVGMAPEATLVVASVANAAGGINSAVIPFATELVFDFAEQLGQSAGLVRMPAVVNVSLGSDFGNHDGTSIIEQALADLVGPGRPGRAIVAAAGNSAGVVNVPKFAYPSPLGIHTEVNLPEGSSLRVPIVSAADPAHVSTLKGRMFVWVSFRPGDEVSVGVDDNSDRIVEPQPFGSGIEKKSASVDVVVVNGALKSSGVALAAKDENAAAVLFNGSWPSSQVFAIRLEGHGTANLWVETGGGLGDEGAVFPAASKEGTISIPASSPSIIAVGATLNRTEWVDRAGRTVNIPFLGAIRNPEPDSIPFFSGAGPTSDLRIKPDIVAPGAFVVGAMSNEADPKTNANSDFASGAPCQTDDPYCAVVDDDHAILSGTSMASPIVAGAAALLFAEKPDRTQDDMLTLLQAGARFPQGLVRFDAQLGAGALDLEGVLDVEHVLDTPARREPSRDTSWMTIAESYAHPDSNWWVPAILQLRDAEGRIADGTDPDALGLEIDHGRTLEGIVRVAPGFFRFAVYADADTGGDTMRVAVTYRGNVLVEKDLPIAVDVNVAREGFSARGGCAVASGAVQGSPLGAGMLAITAVLGRRRTSAVRRARSRDRTDRSARARRD